MEGVPSTNEDDSDKPESSRKKKKKGAEALGAFVFEPAATSRPAQHDAETEQWFEKLFTGDDQSTVEKDENDTETDPAETTPAEDQFIVEQISAAQPESDILAIETFREKIEADHLDPAMAETATYAEYGIDSSELPDELSLPPAENTLSIEDRLTAHEAELPLAGEQIIPLNHRTASASDATEQLGPSAGEEPPAGRGDKGARPPRQPDFSIDRDDTSQAYSASLPPTRRTERLSTHSESRAAGTDPAESIVGYLLGRRQGRIKTEKRLLPIQEKLEKRVAELQRDMVFKETRIRQVVRQQTHQRERITRLERSDRQLRQRTLNTERTVQRVAAPEASHLHSAAAPPEHIGKVIVGAEALSLTAAARQAEQHAATDRKIDKRRVQTMGHNELLAVSETIPVEHSNLRLIYETHLVSEQGLRRLIEVQAEGGNLKKALRREITEHDIDFERDPLLRDRRPESRHRHNAPQPATLNALVAHAVNDNHEQQETAVLRAQITYETTQQIRHQQQRRRIDFGLAGIIMLLTAAVIILLVSR